MTLLSPELLLSLLLQEQGMSEYNLLLLQSSEYEVFPIDSLEPDRHGQLVPSLDDMDPFPQELHPWFPLLALYIPSVHTEI